MTTQNKEELRELYQEVLLDHYKHPRNFQKLPLASHHAEGFNPLCGDKVTVYLKLNGEMIEEISFEGSGCAISTASASLMTDHLKGKTLAQAKADLETFQKMVKGEPCETSRLGKLEILAGVSEFPMRVKCATLAWHTLNAAFNQKEKPVSTE